MITTYNPKEKSPVGGKSGATPYDQAGGKAEPRKPPRLTKFPLRHRFPDDSSASQILISYGAVKSQILNSYPNGDGKEDVPNVRSDVREPD